MLKNHLPSSVTLTINTSISGLSGTRNHAINIATGDIIAFMDDDAVAKEDWLRQLAVHYIDSNVQAAGGKIIPLWEPRRPFWFPEELDWTVGGSHKGMTDVPGPVRNLWGGNMSFRKELFHQVGLFNTQLGRKGLSGEGEDTEFCMRIKASLAGAIILYEPKAIVYHRVHKHRASLKYVIRRSFDGGSSLAKVKKVQRTKSNIGASPERKYLRYLLTASLLGRLKHFYRLRNIAQLSVIVLGVTAWSCGYTINLAKRLRYRQD